MAGCESSASERGGQGSEPSVPVNETKYTDESSESAKTWHTIRTAKIPYQLNHWDKPASELENTEEGNQQVNQQLNNEPTNPSEPAGK